MRKVFLLGFLLLLSAMLAAQQQTVNNDSVIRMIQAGLPEEVIISTINASPGAYDTSVDGLIALKEAEVSEKVLAAIVSRNSGSATGNSGTSTSFPKINKDQKIPTWVQVAGATEGFTSINKELSDSVKDIQNRIKSSNTLVLAPTKQDSIVIMEILYRGIQTTDAAGWDRLGGKKKIDKTTLIVRLIAGVVEEEFKEEGNADSIIAWREAARAVVKNVERWVEQNRNQLTNSSM